MKVLCCIPARYHSTRLPGKPLLKINGKTIINHTYECAKLTNVDKIVILTDDQRIYDDAISFGAECIIITKDCLNGTERIIQYLLQYNIDYDVVINIQGDEPFINPCQVNLAIDKYIEIKQKDPKMVCSTLHYGTYDEKEINTKSRGKLVVDKNNYIMYCSRNIIPTSKKDDIIKDHEYYIHIGVFVYDVEYLKKHYINENTKLQLCEDIEWLKILEQGYKIFSSKVKSAEISVDTIDDYNYLIEKYAE